MNYYQLHTATGRIDVTKEVFDAVEYALSELQGENSKLKVALYESQKKVAILEKSLEWWQREDAQDLEKQFKLRGEVDELRRQLRKQADLNQELSRENVELRSAKANAIQVGYATVKDDLGREADVSQSAYVIVQRMVSQYKKRIDELKSEVSLLQVKNGELLAEVHARKEDTKFWANKFYEEDEEHRKTNGELLRAKELKHTVDMLIKEKAVLKKQLDELCVCYPANEMEVDVLKAIRKARG